MKWRYQYKRPWWENSIIYFACLHMFLSLFRFMFDNVLELRKMANAIICVVVYGKFWFFWWFHMHDYSNLKDVNGKKETEGSKCEISFVCEEADVFEYFKYRWVNFFTGNRSIRGSNDTEKADIFLEYLCYCVHL